MQQYRTIDEQQRDRYARIMPFSTKDRRFADRRFADQNSLAILGLKIPVCAEPSDPDDFIAACYDWPLLLVRARDVPVLEQVLYLAWFFGVDGPKALACFPVAHG